MVGVWCMVGVWWITTAVIIRPSQPSLAGVWAGAELGKKKSSTLCMILSQVLVLTRGRTFSIPVYTIHKKPKLLENFKS